MKKIIRATTVPKSLETFCKGMLRELSEEYEVIGLSSPGEALDIVAAREGVRTIAVPMERRISPMKDLKSLFSVIKVLRKEHPFMIHSMTPKAGLLCMIAGWLTKVPVRVHTFTGLVFPTSTGLKRMILKLTDKITCACATHIIPEGQGVKNDLVNNKITRKPLEVLGYGNVRGVDMVFFSRRLEVMLRMEELGIYDKNKFTFIFVGRIVHDKGINELVQAFIELHRVHPDSRLFLVGRFEEAMDPISPEAKRSIAETDSIHAVGEQFETELLAFYASSDCFVLPSYREGFPNTVLEAGAMGLPCIVTDISGSREIINDGYNGLIVPPRNCGALLKAMNRMIECREERMAMAAVARDHVAAHYEQGFVRHCLYEFYHQITN